MRVLVCPLDWGLGHATRCIPLIRALQGRHQVVVGAGGPGRTLLEREFPSLEIFDFPGYRVRYAARAAFFFPMLLLQAPAVAAGLVAERRRLRREVSARKIDLVISDGRYGCRAQGIPSILVTHQVFLRAPGGAAMRKLLFALNARLLAGFREVWVPDFAGAVNLGGELAHGPHGLPSLKYIGPLARFPFAGAPAPRLPRPDVLALASGPEPQRGLFTEALRRELSRLPGTRVLVRGLPTSPAGKAGKGTEIRPGELNEFDHLDGPALEELMRNAGLIVSRSGYTTLMEMAALGVRRAVFVPTPGQTEQEYLAHHMQALRVGPRLGQDSLDLAAVVGGDPHAWSGFSDFRPAAEASLGEFLSRHPLLRETAAHIF